MRAWMYQLNPDRGSYFLVRGARLPTTVENLNRELRQSIVGDWTCHQFFADAERGDPVLIKIGGREAAGVVALCRVHRAGRGDDGAGVVSFTVDRQATAALQRAPIPVIWLQKNVPTSMRNLVKLEPIWGRWRRS